MKIRGVVFVVLIICISCLGRAQENQKPASSQKNNQTAQMHVVPDLKQRLARFRQEQIALPSASLTAREQKMISKLVDASRYLDEIYWRQVDPDGLDLYESLAKSTDPKRVELRRSMW